MQSITQNKKIKADPKHIASFPFCKLPTELQTIVVTFVFEGPLTKKPKKAANTVRNLSQINKDFYQKINSPVFSDTLIEKYSQRFLCSQESIARFLHTPQAKNRLTLQRTLKDLCFSRYSKLVIQKKLTKLINQGINLEFTYS